MREMRLHCSEFYVDVRLRRLNRRWIASADTQDGPTLGWGATALDALELALEPFAGVMGELLASVPQEYLWTRWQPER